MADERVPDGRKAGARLATATARMVRLPFAEVTSIMIRQLADYWNEIRGDKPYPFKKDFDAAKVDYRIIQYPGAVHAFTNPESTALGKKFNLPLKYDAKANQQATAEATKFFAADLRK